MAALATQADVEAVLGRTLTAAEVEKVLSELDKASAYIRAETRRPFDASPLTVDRKVRDNGTVTLADVESVTAVSEVDCEGDETALTAGDDYTVRGSKIYGLAPRTWVEVTYTPDATVPDDLVALCAQLAATGVTSRVTPGLESVTKGPFSESYVEGAHGYMLSADQAKVLRRHSRPRFGSVTLL